MPFSLRDYQLTAADNVQKQFSDGIRSTLVEWATGLGKTVLAAEIIRRWLPRPCLFLCHRKELLDQAVAKIEEHTGLECLVERGEHRCSPDSLFGQEQPVVATVQSLNGKWGQAKRMNKFKPELVICDEVHHSRARTYEHIFNYVGEGCKLLGITATPKRHDKKALGKHFQEVAHRYQLEQAVRDGYLVDIAAESIKVLGLDYSKLRIVRGDFDQEQLKAMLEVEETIQRMCHPSLEIIYGVNPRGSLANLPPTQWQDYLSKFGKPRKTLMFCASVAHARLAAEIFNRVVKDIAAWVCGETPTKEREQIIANFRDGTVPILCNMGIATEGFDEPSIEVVLHGRPTAVLGLYQQMLGRVTRPMPGVIDGLARTDERLSAIKGSTKPFARSVDFVDNSLRNKLVTSVDILGGDYSDEVKQRAITRTLNKPVMIAVTLSNMEKEIQSEQKRKKLEQERLDAERKRGLVAAAHYHSQDVQLFGKSGKPFVKSAPREKQPATDKQKYRLGKCGIYPLGWTLNQAKMIIGILANNGWTLPADPKYDWIRNHGKNRGAA